jgi:hypothetical protein
MKDFDVTAAWFGHCPSWRPRAVILLAFLALWAGTTATARADPKVTVLKTPNDGIQPQAVVDAKGNLHLIYFKGDAGAGDLFYVRRDAGQERFSAPIRVNSQAGSALATGTVRGGQMALGKGGRVHVAWNGSDKAQPKSQGRYTSPMLYARLGDAGTAFEDQRNLMQVTTALNGGGTIAADQEGNVYVAWHAVKVGGPATEENREVWVAISSDEGRTFGKEVPANPKPTGVCGCCSTRAFADSKGSVYLLYRSAKDSRDIYLLTSRQNGKRFQGALLHPWETLTCPMSTMALVEGPSGVRAAWDTEGQIYFARIKPGTTDFTEPQSAPGPGKGRKHPAVAVNGQGEMIVAWTEGTGWKQGGALAWQVFDKTGEPTEQKGRVDSGIAVWGLPAVVVTDGGFTILH